MEASSKARGLPWAGVAALGLALVGVAWLFLTADASPLEDRRFFTLWRLRALFVGVGLLTAATLAALATIQLRAVFAALLAGMLACVTLLCVELAGLVGVVSYDEIFGHSSEVILGGQLLPNADLSGETYMDTTSRFGLPSEPIPFRYKTDAHGLRNHVDRDAADIYLLGDSVLVSGLLPFRETVTGILDRTLSQSVMNVALIDISPSEEHELFRGLGLPLRDRWVLQFIFEGNDLLDMRDERVADELSFRERLVDASFSYNALMWLQRKSQPVLGMATRQMCEIAGQPYTFLWDGRAFEGLASEQAKVEHELEAFAGWVREQGGDFAVVFVPAKLRVLAGLCEWPADSALSDSARHIGPMRADLAAWGKKSRVPVLDLTSELRRVAESGRVPWFWGDTHMNEAGHQVAADAIANWSVVGAAPSGDRQASTGSAPR
jgi:hypothetical protein